MPEEKAIFRCFLLPALTCNAMAHLREWAKIIHFLVSDIGHEKNKSLSVYKILNTASQRCHVLLLTACSMVAAINSKQESKELYSGSNQVEIFHWQRLNEFERTVSAHLGFSTFLQSIACNLPHKTFIIERVFSI